MVATSRVTLDRARPLSTPWSFRLFRRSPWRPAITGLLFGLVLLSSLVLFELFSGRPQRVLAGDSPADVGCAYLLGDYRIGVLGVILLAYTFTVRYILARWTHQTADQLGLEPFIDAETLAETRSWGFLPGLAGSVLCLLLAVDIAESPVTWTREYWILPHILNWGWCIPFGWAGGRFIYATIVNSFKISRGARSIEIRDLSETQPLDAAIRHGSRSALLSLMFLGLISVHFLDPGLGLPAILLLVTLFLVGAVISAMPALGVSQVLFDIRDAKLNRLRHEIDVEEQQLLDKDPDYEPGRIGDIVALEQRLSNWRITVFRLSNVVRLLVYAGIGFASWLGAATVSAFVENMFGF